MNIVSDDRASYGSEVNGWRLVPAEDLPRRYSDVLVESMVREALIRLNPEIKEQPDRADEVLYRLRAIPLSVQSEGLVRANEMFAEWLRGEKSMPFGENGEHASVRLIDFDDLGNNDYVVTSQWVYPVKEGGRRFD
ncbi:MAG: type I restriction endonuclease subunit R, partial [Desulfobulbaceae bacterium]|nr:type I restriction endonuclease subunit R [Desulfobulbaceae bacterium]